MSTSPSSTPPDPALPACECENFMRSACRHEKFYKEHDGKRYCVLHYPGTEKTEDFQKALRRKLSSEVFDFQGVWFPDAVSFHKFTFGAATNFSGAHFNALADFSDANFGSVAIFKAAHFKAVANFVSAQFKAEARFDSTHFVKSARFSDAQFSADTHFNEAQFSENAAFEQAHFNAAAYFFTAQFSMAASFTNTHFVSNAYFDGAEFSAMAYFTHTRFNSYAYFNNAQFSAAAYFNYARFSKSAKFYNVVFKATVSFEGTSFIEEGSSRHNSTISDNKATDTTDVIQVEANTIEVTFTNVSFEDGVIFEENKFAEQVFISFAAATFEKPERVIFHTAPLRPHWFVNVDSRKFTFINVDWGLLDKRGAILKEMAALKSNERDYSGGLLEITFRQLAVNAEENNRYEEAANFRYMAMEMRRRQRGRKLDLFRLSWWYWLLSGYGERVTRAFGALLVIWLLFAFVYQTGDATWWQPKQSAKLAAAAENIEQGQQPAAVAEKQPDSKDLRPAVSSAPLTLPEALIYSAGVMTLQKPEPLAANKRAKAFVLLETILGPLQAALLALAIRRKFMR